MDQIFSWYHISIEPSEYKQEPGRELSMYS
jgi:hypothetical protein